MTLAKVAKKVPLEFARINDRQVARNVVRAFEADPEFELPGRLEALVKDLEKPYEPGLDGVTRQGILRRLREVQGGRPGLLEGKKSSGKNDRLKHLAGIDVGREP